MSWKYTIRDDTSGDQILFMAYYEFVDGEQTTTIGSDSCVAYSSSILGADADYAETIVAVTPTWCIRQKNENDSQGFYYPNNNRRQTK